MTKRDSERRYSCQCGLEGSVTGCTLTYVFALDLVLLHTSLIVLLGLLARLPVLLVLLLSEGGSGLGFLGLW